MCYVQFINHPFHFSFSDFQVDNIMWPIKMLFSDCIYGREYWTAVGGGCHDFPSRAAYKIQNYSIENSLHGVLEKLRSDERLSQLVPTDSIWYLCDTGLLYKACEAGVADMVTLFLTYPDLHINDMRGDHTCLSIACLKGHIEVVRLLLGDPRVKPTIGNNLAYRTAVTSQQQEIADLLLEKCNIKHKFDVNYVKRLRSRR